MPLNESQASWFLTRNGSEIVKNYAQVFAWVGAAFFFGIKVFQGFFIVDLSLTLATNREKSSNRNLDYLVISVDMRRGSQGTFRMHDAAVIVSQEGKAMQVLELGIERFESSKQDGLYSIDPANFDKEVRTLNLAPGDSTCLTALAEVVRHEPCRVEVVIIGRKFFSPKPAQWRAAATSLPLAK